MARIRTLKPEFWQNEKLATVSESALLLAIGLLNYADDEGYFNANHALIRAAIFPIREPSVSIPVMLRELSGIGYVALGKGSEGRIFGRVVKFLEHQSINKPSKSKIDVDSIAWDGFPDGYRNTTGGLPGGTGNREQGTGNREGVAVATLSAAKETKKPQPADPGEGGINPEMDTKTDEEKTSSVIDNCPQQEILQLFSDTLPMLTQPRMWEGQREKLLRDRWKACSREKGINGSNGYKSAEEGMRWWREFFEYVGRVPKLTNGIPRADGSVWKPDLPWLLKAENFAKVIEGRYEQ